MTPERWARLELLLHAALEREPQARPAFVDASCAGDPELRESLLELLEADAAAGEFLSPASFERMAAGFAAGEGEGPALAPGAHVGPYEVLALLEVGGMGEVYRARDARLGRDVALKVIRAGLARDPEGLRRFDAEARAAAAISDPNVVAIYDVGLERDMPYVVSELLEGETLGAALRRGPLGLVRSLDCAVQIARGLVAAHERGVVHRDLKPDNVFVTRHGRVKLLDFGIAKLASGTSGEEPPPPGEGVRSTLAGTPGFIAPEQLEGRPVDQRADVFALGAILHLMLTGRAAFVARTPEEALHATLEGEPPPLGAGEGVPPSLSRIVARALRKRPEDRFESAQALLEALQAVPADPGARRRRLAVLAAVGLAAVAATWLGRGWLAARVGQPDRGVAAARADGAPHAVRRGPAHEAYLRGRHHWNLRTREAAPRAIAEFNRALELDPLHAGAWAGLADTYVMLGDMLYQMPAADAFARGEAAARRALELEPGLAEAHATLGHLHMHAWRWKDAEASFARALELDPRYASARQWRAYNHASLGRFDEALEEIRRALEADPLSVIINSDRAQILWYAGRDEEALRQCENTLRMSPEFAEARRVAFLTLLSLGRREEALAGVEAYRRLPDGGVGGSVGWAYAVLGRRAEARAVLAEVVGRVGAGAEPAYDAAVVHAGLGEADAAFAWLERSLANVDPESMILPVDPRLASLRADPRFAALLGKLHLGPLAR